MNIEITQRPTGRKSGLALRPWLSIAFVLYALAVLIYLPHASNASVIAAAPGGDATRGSEIFTSAAPAAIHWMAKKKARGYGVCLKKVGDCAYLQVFRRAEKGQHHVGRCFIEQMADRSRQVRA